MTVEEVAAEPNYGAFQSDVFGDNNPIQVGTTNDICMNQAMVDCRGTHGNRSTNDLDLTCFLDNYPGACDALGLDGSEEAKNCVW